MSEVLVKVDNISKKFCRSLKRSLWYGVKDIGSELVGGKVQDGSLRKDEFWAVRDVSFELKRGECLGLIGHNGAGKSTLLKMLNGLIKPDYGKIEMRGRIGALIELGAGFNPILTGRENIYINGSVLGLSKTEIDKKLKSIIEFAEIDDFIDTPVQYYSSGMKVRLGFAVASQLDPDVLIIDEVLAVGDAGFKIKCYNEIYKISERAAIIFVSHSMPQIAKISDRLLLLKHGVICLDSRNKDVVINEYYQQFESPLKNYTISEDFSFKNLRIFSVESNEVVADSTILENGIKADIFKMQFGDTLNIKLHYRLGQDVKNYFIIYSFTDLDQKEIAQCFSEVIESNYEDVGEVSILTTIPSFNLNQGKYSLGITIKEVDEDYSITRILATYRNFLEMEIQNNNLKGAASVQYKGVWKVELINSEK